MYVISDSKSRWTYVNTLYGIWLTLELTKTGIIKKLFILQVCLCLILFSGPLCQSQLCLLVVLHCSQGLR